MRERALRVNIAIASTLRRGGAVSTTVVSFNGNAAL
jgi:hypothetical protein